MVFVVAGWGWTEVDGERFEWGPGDSMHMPAWAWHRSGNDGEATARYMTFSSEPLLATMGMSVLEDAGHADVRRPCRRRPPVLRGPDRRRPLRPPPAPGGRRAGQRRNGRLHTT